MSLFTQENRLLSLATPLGADALLLTGFSGQEALSRLFAFQLDVLSDRPDITAKEIVGKKVAWSVARTDAEPRWFNGYVSRFAASGRGLYDLRAYQLEVVPWLWFLTRSANCRNFPPNMTAPEIIAKIFADYGFADVDDSRVAGGPYPKREYCVQYRETAFNFVSRLMEEEGIFYYWKHAEDKHTLVLARQKSDYADCPEKEVNFSSGSLAEESHITSWRHAWECRSGVVTHTDYNFETPKLLPARDMITFAKTIIDLPEAKDLELFDYPGDYKIKDDGGKRIDVRMQEEEVGHDVVTGVSNCGTFHPGGKFTLTEHDVETESGQEYVLTQVQHEGRDTTYGNAGDTAYHNSFQCIPAAVTFRPARLTPRPVIHGVQTAIVVGPPGEEIHTDKYGRVQVQFHWDREHKYDEKSSYWLRVSTLFAGKNYGIINLPRVGHEVLVDFLEGDPDRPLVVGSVYNADHMPPGNLPKDKMIGGLRSATYPGGKGYNGLIFDDSKGKEMITLHGQHDMSTTIEHDDTQHIKNDRKITVDGTHTETIDKDTTITIKTGNYVHDVKAGTALYHVKGAVSEKFEASQETIVKAGIHIASETAHIYIHTATSIQLHVGASTIWMDEGGQIAIRGNNVAIEGKESVTIAGGMVRSEAKSTHETAGGNVISEAKGSNTVKGGMVMLNP